ncbi:MAG: 5'/3'-nucleotidase SurE [Myxococcota bacterium]|nr:5'/3'-nucleotidase SurE [Myxococcota bacterium]
MDALLTVLLTNDDGIDAPGIRALESKFLTYDNVELWVVAPDKERSTTSHGMTLTRPIFSEPRGQRRFAASGLPADCVYLGMFGLMPRLPNVVVSGINRGANLGRDVIYSGTVAAAREAALDGVHGIAASLVFGDDYGAAASSVCEIALEIARQPAAMPLLLNLNYPGGTFRGPCLAPLGARTYPRVVSKRTAPIDNRTYYWLGGPRIEDQERAGTDGALIAAQIASATFLRVDQTDQALTAKAAPISTIASIEGAE